MHSERGESHVLKNARHLQTPHIVFSPESYDEDEDGTASNNLYSLSSDEENELNRLREVSSVTSSGDGDDAPTNEEGLNAGEEVLRDVVLFNALIGTFGEGTRTMNHSRQLAERLVPPSAWRLHEPVRAPQERRATAERKRCVDYQGLAKAYDGPTTEVLEVASSPMSLFFFFLPKSLWRRIAEETNLYYGNQENIPNDRKARKFPRTGSATSPANERFTPVEPHELGVYIGLLIARLIKPNMEGLSKHWSTCEDGAISPGNFQKNMTQNRFVEISSNLHFDSDTPARDSQPDPLQKLHVVVETLHQTFLRGHTVPNVASYGVDNLPPHQEYSSKINDPQNRLIPWQSQRRMLCSAQDGYCVGRTASLPLLSILRLMRSTFFSLSFGVFLGVKKTRTSSRKRGAIGLLRLLSQVYGDERQDDTFRLIVNASPKSSGYMLLMQLYSMGFYVVGAVKHSRVDYTQALPASLPRQRPGEYQASSLSAFPRLNAVAWKSCIGSTDHFIALGGSMDPDTVSASPHGLPCPRVVKQYIEYSQSVKKHFELQRFSLQRTTSFTKYYRTLFLGLLDMALVNAYIVHQEYCRQQRKADPTYIGFLKALQRGLCRLTAADF